MDIHWIVFAAVLVLSALTALVVAILLIRMRPAPGRTAMALSLATLAVWAFCYAMITLSPSLEAKHFWLKLENVGIILQPVFWIVFTLKYIYPEKTVKPILLAALFIIPLVGLTFLFSEQWFHLYYASTRLASSSGGPLVITRGPWYWPQLTYSYLLDGIATVILLRRFIIHRDLYRRRMGFLIVATLIPWIVNIFYQFALSLIPTTVQVDFTPISFTISAIMIRAGVFGLRLFDLLPIARDVVMEHIPEMVVVVDAHDRVLDANSIAQKWLEKDARHIIGQDPLDVFRAWPQLVSRFLSAHETHEEIQVGGDPPRTLELIVTPIYNPSHILQGRVIVAHDVTDRKILENNLKQANTSLRTQLAEIESLRAKLQEQAIRDPLTSVFNRRFFAEALDKEVARAVRDGNPISVVILDVDWFKQFNDTYGHKCGDLVLQSLAGFLVQNTRGGDIVCRYGGEEFVILMPNTTPEIALERAEAWRGLYQSTSTEYRGQSLTATFSAGVAGYPAHGADGEAILYAADQALYQSKNEGRNRVTLFAAGTASHKSFPENS